MVDAPPAATCPWPIDTSCFDEAWDDLDPEVQDRSLDLASATLRRLSGYRVGGCPITVRPCKAACGAGVLPSYYQGGGSLFYPHLVAGGLWVNSCGCRTDCACAELCEIALPAPVGRVDSVVIDGEVVDPDDYRVDGNRLVSLTADCPFPACQDMAAADTEPGTFSITYLNAAPVDRLGAYAAGVLAMEFAKGCTGGKCRLPAGVTAVARQGVSMQIVTGAFPGGLTGIREVDAWIALWNPKGHRQQTQVWSPDMPSPRVVPTGVTP